MELYPVKFSNPVVIVALSIAFAVLGLTSCIEVVTEPAEAKTPLYIIEIGTVGYAENGTYSFVGHLKGGAGMSEDRFLKFDQHVVQLVQKQKGTVLERIPITDKEGYTGCVFACRGPKPNWPVPELIEVYRD